MTVVLRALGICVLSCQHFPIYIQNPAPPVSKGPGLETWPNVLFKMSNFALRRGDNARILSKKTSPRGVRREEKSPLVQDGTWGVVVCERVKQRKERERFAHASNYVSRKRRPSWISSWGWARHPSLVKMPRKNSKRHPHFSVVLFAVGGACVVGSFGPWRLPLLPLDTGPPPPSHGPLKKWKLPPAHQSFFTKKGDVRVKKGWTRASGFCFCDGEKCSPAILISGHPSSQVHS